MTVPMSPPEQLVLPIHPARYQTFASFVDTGNELARESVWQLADGISLSQQLWLTGPTACGKTHLLQAACQHIRQQGTRAIYVDMNRQPCLEGLESLDLIALDNLDALQSRPSLQESLFHLLNRCQTRPCRLLAASRLPPGQLGTLLPDLQSRLLAFQQVRLHAITDTGLQAVTHNLCRQLQMDCPPAVQRHLQLHGPRELHGLTALLFRLAETSLRLKRRPTLPLLRELMQAK